MGRETMAFYAIGRQQNFADRQQNIFILFNSYGQSGNTDVVILPVIK